MAQIAAFDELDKILEALRAVRDPSVNMQGLEALRQVLRAPQAATIVLELLERTPGLTILQEIWETQLTAKNDGVISSLLLLVADLIPFLAASPIPGQQGASRELVSYIISRRVKALYYYLSSDSKPKAHAALILLSAVARHSVQSARQLVHSFDFTLSALLRLGRLPREKRDVDQAEAHRRLLDAWQAPDSSKRPSVSLLVDFALSLLQHADATLLQRLLSVRIIWSAMLGQLSQYPPAVVKQILAVIQDKVMSLGGSVPGSLQAEPFADSALSQIAAVAAWEADDSADDGDSSTAVACAAAAQQMLLRLMTETSHGIAPPVMSALSSPVWDDMSGKRRVSRLLQALKGTSVLAHYDLLLSIGRLRPDLASTYLASCQLSLDPKHGLKWLAGMSLLGSMIQLCPVPDFAPLSQRQTDPKAMASRLVSACITSMIPPPISKGILTKGLQHCNALVQQATLSTLCHVLSTVERVLASLEGAQHIEQRNYDILLRDCAVTTVQQDEAQAFSLPGTAFEGDGQQGSAAIVVDEPLKAQDVSESSPTPVEKAQQGPECVMSVGAKEPELAAAKARLSAWQSLSVRLLAAAAAKLPDLATLLALHASLADSHSASQASEEVSQEAMELSGRKLILLHLLKVLAAYVRCLPGLCNAARFKAWHLLPQETVSMHPSLQHAAQTVLEASLASSDNATTRPQASSAQLAALLQLLQGQHAPMNPTDTKHRTGPTVLAQLTYRVAQCYLEQAVGFSHLAEVHLWLDCLPKASAEDGHSRDASAVASFLAEAVGLLLRKPHEMWELQQDILEESRSGKGARLAQPDTSLLPVTVLRQAIRVAGSSKMPEACIVAVCKYVQGVLRLLLRVQADQKPLSVVISGVIARHVSASAAGSPQDKSKSSAQQHSDRAAALQSASRVSSAKQPREQARPSKRRRSGIDSASTAQAAAERLNGHIVTMQTSGTDADRDAAVPRKRSKRELNHITEGQETLRQGSEAAMEVLQSLGACAAYGTAAYGHDNRDSEERCLQHFIGSIPGATDSPEGERKIKSAIQQIPHQQRAVPALAIACAFSPGAELRAVSNLLGGLRFCLLEQEGSDLTRDRLQVLRAVLRHPSLLSSYLANLGSPSNSEANRDACMSELLACILERCEAAEEAGEGILSRNWAEVSAGTKPYLLRTLQLLESSAALQQEGRRCDGAGDAYVALARYLPLERTAAAALSLLRDSDKHSPWRAEHGVRVAAGLLRHKAVRDKPLADLCPPQLSGLLSLVARNVQSNEVGNMAVEGLVELLTSHPPEQALLSWHLGGEACNLVGIAIRQPSQARCTLAAILIRALPLDLCLFATWLSEELPKKDLNGVALLAPVMRTLLEQTTADKDDEDLQLAIAFCSEALLQWVASEHGKDQGHVSIEAGRSLQRDGVPVLEMCLNRRPLQLPRMLSLLHQLACTNAWSKRTRPEQCSSYDTVSSIPQPEQQVAMASYLTWKLADGGQPRAKAGAALSCFGVATLATAARLMRRRDAEEAERGLLQQLEGMIGGLLPDLLLKQPLSHWEQDEQLPLLAAARQYATAVLRRFYRSARRLSLLAGLLASLLSGSSLIPLVAELACDLAELVMLHSEFRSLMLESPEQPLPKAAAGLAAPLTSLLPLVSVQDPGKRDLTPKEGLLHLIRLLLGSHSAHEPCAAMSAHWDSLTPVLAMGYGATLSRADRGMLRLIRTLSVQKQGSAANAMNEGGAWGKLGMTDGVAGMGYVFGGAAQALFDLKLLPGNPEQESERTRVLRDELAIDARRCGLTVVHWPEDYIVRWQELVSSGSEDSDGAPATPSDSDGHVAAYDPVFLLPFTLQVVREELMTCLEVATSGLLAVALRGLACGSAVLRSCAYEVLAHYNDMLEASNFREKTQLCILMDLVRQSVTELFQRIPALTAVYLAEASFALTQPASALFPAISRHLLRRPALDLEEAPLLKPLLGSSGPEHAAERLWLARLLAAGFCGQTEGEIFRRQFVAELLMSVHGTSLANAELAEAVEDVIYRACTCAATYAADLVQHAGLVSWLVATVAAKLQQSSPQDLPAASLEKVPGDEPERAGASIGRLLASLQALLSAKEWLTRAQFGSLGALDVFAQAVAHLLSALSEHRDHWWTLPSSAAILEFAVAVQQRINASWGTETRQPMCQPWPQIALLLAPKQALARDHSRLLLQFILASPPCQGTGGCLSAVACWALEAASELCLQHPPSPPTQPEASCQERLSLAARVLPWLAARAVSDAFGCVLRGASAGQPAAASGAGGAQIAERVVQLFYLLGPRLRSSTASAAALALAQVLQPEIAALLLDDASPLAQGVPEKGKWRFLLGNTMLRMLAHVELSGSLIQHWQALAVGTSSMDTSAGTVGSVPEVGCAAASTADMRAAHDGMPSHGGAAMSTAEAHAAVDMLMVMLPEFCMRLAPALTLCKLAEWESGRAGEAKQRLAAVELRHARAVGVELELLTLFSMADTAAKELLP